MGIIGDFQTIPEIYQMLIEKYGGKNSHPVFRQKTEEGYQPISYDTLQLKTESFSLGLAALGIKAGDNVGIISENRPEWIYTDLAILSLGAVDVPLYPTITADSIRYTMCESESKAIVVSTSLQLNKLLKVRQKCKHLKYIIVLNESAKIEGEKHLYTFKEVQDMGIEFGKKNPGYLKREISKIKPDDLATIIYTSGTTGEPKGVMLTHNNILSNVKDCSTILDLSPNDRFVSFLPLCHIFERTTGYYTAFACGSTITHIPNIEGVAQALIDEKPTVVTTVPRLFERIYSKILRNIEKESAAKQKLFFWAINIGREFHEKRRNGKIPFTLKTQHKLAQKLVHKKLQNRFGGHLRYFVSGGAPLSRELGEFFEAVGIVILEGYGLTESSPVIAVNRENDYKFGTVGKVFPSVEVKIAHDGEILARGPNIMQGYYKKKKETAETIKDGWLHTGDMGVFDQDGFLMITDRKKHLFKTSTGKYVAPAPIENTFLSSKYIDQFVLIGDSRTYLSALIVPDFETLREYADSHKLQYKDESELARSNEIYKLIEAEIHKLQKGLNNFEKIRKFSILDQAFSLESGEMTPSLKIKRKVVEERYKHLIDGMYN
jgi:long-chain acyl-CoA synthetase